MQGASLAYTPPMLRIVATYNVKGGVGKTTAAVNLAWLAARDGWRTLLWDLDPQGGAGFCLDIERNRRLRSRKLIAGKLDLAELCCPTAFENLDVLPADHSYRNMDLHLEQSKKPAYRLLKMMRPLRKHYDLLLLDCAPSISLVSENVFRAADLLVMPVLPNPLSLRAVGQVREFLKREKLKDIALLPFFSMVDRRRKLHRELVDDAPESLGRLSSAVIPYASDVERMTLRRAPVCSYAPASRAAEAFEALWADMRACLGSGPNR